MNSWTWACQKKGDACIENSKKHYPTFGWRCRVTYIHNDECDGTCGKTPGDGGCFNNAGNNLIEKALGNDPTNGAYDNYNKYYAQSRAAADSALNSRCVYRTPCQNDNKGESNAVGQY